MESFPPNFLSSTPSYFIIFHQLQNITRSQNSKLGFKKIFINVKNLLIVQAFFYCRSPKELNGNCIYHRFTIGMSKHISAVSEELIQKVKWMVLDASTTLKVVRLHSAFTHTHTSLPIPGHHLEARCKDKEGLSDTVSAAAKRHHGIPEISPLTPKAHAHPQTLSVAVKKKDQPRRQDLWSRFKEDSYYFLEEDSENAWISFWMLKKTLKKKILHVKTMP